MRSEVQISNKGKILEGILLFNPILYKDIRGIFFESWNKKKFDDALKKNISFVQDNQSISNNQNIKTRIFQYPRMIVEFCHYHIVKNHQKI